MGVAIDMSNILNLITVGSRQLFCYCGMKIIYTVRRSLVTDKEYIQRTTCKAIDWFYAAKAQWCKIMYHYS